MISGKTLVVVGVAALASSTSINAQMVGGNGLCADPASLGPNAAVGAYAPIRTADQEATSNEVAIAGTRTYLNKRNVQSDLDKLIIKTCRPSNIKMIRSVEVDAACSQVVAGTNYMVKSTFEVPCSRNAVKKLPAGTSLVRTIITESFESLDGKIKITDVYADDDDSNGLLQSSGNRKMLQSQDDDIVEVSDIGDVDPIDDDDDDDDVDDDIEDNEWDEDDDQDEDDEDEDEWDEDDDQDEWDEDDDQDEDDE